MIKINEIVKKIEIPDEYIENYGKYKAKIDINYYDQIKDKKDAKLILVSAINPTPMGEGKTTQSIGLSMALKNIGKNAIAVLREPSLGPVFGMKGGAVGGGMATIEPQDDINLHFTNDFHAITSANNLLVAVIENHIYQGNKLNIDKKRICIKRVIDMNDRGLRKINVGADSKNEYMTGFEITAACELMAICCLSENIKSLKENIDNMLVAYTFENEPIYVRELNVSNAMIALLKNAINPNLVQTIEGTPCLVHLGPFANIAHGCNSIIATKMGIKMADYCVTEAGFGADLGAEKFFDIKCRKFNLKPDIVVLVVTVKALKYNGGIEISKLNEKGIDALKKGICNLEKNIENIKKFGMNLVVGINKYESDTEEEINYIKKFCEDLKVKCEVSTSYIDGSKGSESLAKLVVSELETNKSHFKLLYSDNETVEVKIEKICKEIYGAKGIIYLEKAKKELENVKRLGFSDLPICIAKTPLSLSDNEKLLGRPVDFDVTIRDIKIDSGAGFIVVYAGNIMTMPGLGKNSKYLEF